jgi:hypothetical protein
MKPLLLLERALAGALLICGCSGEGGPAIPVGTPFGVETAGGGSEPASGAGTLGGSENSPPGAGASIAEICAFDCMRVEALCPDGMSSSCPSSCSAFANMYPTCLAQLRAYFLCVETAAIACEANGQISVNCPNEISAVSNCVSNPPQASP